MESAEFCEVEKRLQWRDFHDSTLISLSFHFFEKNDDLYKSKIIMEIETSFYDNPEKAVTLSCTFLKVRDIAIDALMDDEYLADSSDIYSLSKNNGKIELVTAKGWKLTFFCEAIHVTMEGES